MADLAHQSREELRTHLEKRIDKSRHYARRDDAAAGLCYLVAIIGSLAATLCAAIGDLPRWVNATITGIPATALLMNSVFAYDQKSRWHRRRKLKCEDFLLRLKFEDGSVAGISSELREFEAKLDGDYPRFGALGGKDRKEP